VTGGATGIGFAISKALSRRGVKVGLADITKARAQGAADRLTAEGASVLGLGCDVRDAGDIERALDELEQAFGTPTVLVANAGVYPNESFLTLSESEWDRVLDTNLKGVFLVGQAVARRMVHADCRGAIVNVSSGAATNSLPGWSHYAASKAGVSALTRGMALELAEFGIRVNTVVPGYIDVEEGGAHLAETYKLKMRDSVPLGRPGTRDDVANAVLFLISPMADYITGTSLVVDGGSSVGRAGLIPTGESQPSH